MSPRAVKALTGKLGVAEGVVADDLSPSVGQSGCAHPLLVLTAVLEDEARGQAAGDLGPGRSWP